MNAKKRKQKALKITTETYNKIYERDQGCVLCKRLGYHEKNNFNAPLECHHIVSRAKLGMGIEQNLVMLCKNHHLEESFYREDLEKYMKEKYEHWNKADLVFKKWG